MCFSIGNHYVKWFPKKFLCFIDVVFFQLPLITRHNFANSDTDLLGIDHLITPRRPKLPTDLYSNKFVYASRNHF